ncbi:1-aminocyclopropane-1-carboxylate deaminase/D-cysteine desulfhydrase [Catenovulum sediminis]|uniref:Pyridoxal-phosphate dependent enzyme n=1 Tax=Catenovulum sediminis TaxID=1740262 RepID=A0ABV1RCZ9_9ALTE|nr:pyridoxal-phosphate dependent enzyme [Catenovulum sediminis]
MPLEKLVLPSPLQKLDDQRFVEKSVEVYLKRDDLIHPVISGNKWRKLKYFIAQHDSHLGVLSFGGAFSNHLVALAYACNQRGIPSVGIVRGERSSEQNSTLSYCQKLGMQLHFADRQTYKKRNQVDYWRELQAVYPNYVILPEGGRTKEALLGVGEIITEVPLEFTHIVCPVGSGTTLAGLAAKVQYHQQVIGVAALAKADYLRAEVEQLLMLQDKDKNNWQLMTDFHLGGFAKSSPDLLSYIQRFYQLHQVTLDPIYTGKMCMAFEKMLLADKFPPGSKIILLHTGGLQGWHGFKQMKRVNDDYLASINWLPAD